MTNVNGWRNWSGAKDAAAVMVAASGPFMSAEPRPISRPWSICGENGSRPSVARHGVGMRKEAEAAFALALAGDKRDFASGVIFIGQCFDLEVGGAQCFGQICRDLLVTGLAGRRNGDEFLGKTNDRRRGHKCVFLVAGGEGSIG